MALQYSIQSELMPNHLPGTPVVLDCPLDNFLYGATANDGSHLIFARTGIDDFSIFVPSATHPSGREQVSISAALLRNEGPVLSILAACVKQKQDGTIRIALAALVGTPTNHFTYVFYADCLEPYTDAAAWENIKDKFKSNMFLDNYIGRIDMGEETDALDYIYVWVKTGMDYGHLYAFPVSSETLGNNPILINSGPNDQFSSFAAGRYKHPMPDGTYSINSGIYICWGTINGILINFHSFPTKTRPNPLICPLSYIPELVQLTSKTQPRNQDELTTLYTLSDNKLQCWTPEMQTAASPPTKFVSPGNPTAHPKFIRSIAGDFMLPIGVFSYQAIFFTNQNGQLFQCQDSGLGDLTPPINIENPDIVAAPVRAFAWKDPSPLSGGNLQLLRARPLGGSSSTFYLELMEQDFISGQWQQELLLVKGSDAYTQVPTYTTHISITDANNNPQPLKEFQLQPNQNVSAYIGGKLLHFESQLPRVVTSDAMGQISIMVVAHKLSAPQWHIKEVSDHLAPWKWFNSCEETIGRIYSIQTMDDIKTAKRSSNGKPLFPEGISDYACITVRNYLRELWIIDEEMKAFEKKQDDSAHKQPGKKALKAARTVEFEFRKGQPLQIIVHEGKKMPGGNPVVGTSFGMIMEYLGTLVPGTGGFSLISWEGAHYITVNIGNYLYQAVLYAQSALMQLTDWVLRNTLDITLNDVIDWLGFVFNWDDVLLNQRAIRAMFNCGLNYGKQRLHTDGKVLVEQAFDWIKENLSGGIPPIDPNLKPFMDSTIYNFGKQVEEVGPKDNSVNETIKTPQWHWLNSKFNDYRSFIVVNGTLTSDWQGLTFSDEEKQTVSDLENRTVWPNFNTDTISKIFEDLYAYMKDLLDKLITLVKNKCLEIVDAFDILLNAFIASINLPIEMPILTAFYKQYIDDKEPFTILNAVCLMAAAPFTVMMKLLLNRNPFTENNVTQMELAAETGDYMTLMNVVSVSPTEDATVSLTPVIVSGVQVVLLFFDACVILGYAFTPPKDDDDCKVYGRMNFFVAADKIINIVSYSITLGYTAYILAENQYHNNAWFRVFATISLARFLLRCVDIVALCVNCQKDPPSNQKSFARMLNLTLRFLFGIANIVVAAIIGGIMLFNYEFEDEGEVKLFRIISSFLTIGYYVAVGFCDFLTAISIMVRDVPVEEKQAHIWMGVIALGAVGAGSGRTFTSYKSYELNATDIGIGVGGN